MSEWHDADEHIKRAHEFYELGRWEEAEAELRKALSMDPDQPEWLYNLGLTLEAAGRIEEAVTAFTSAHKLAPDNPHPLVSLGINENRLNRPIQALEHLKKAQKLAPNHEPAYCPQIVTLSMLNRHEDAEHIYYMARLIKDECPVCYSNMGESLLKRRLYEKAIWCFKEAARLDPRMRRVHARLGTIHAMQGQYEQAYRLYLRDLREDPGNIDTLLDLGKLFTAMNRLPEAAEKFRRILELEPTNTDAHFRLGQLAIHAQRYDVARIEFELVYKLDPDYPGLSRQMANVMVKTGSIDSARSYLISAMESVTEDEPDLLGLAETLIAADMRTEACEILQKLTIQKPDDPQAWHKLAAINFLLGNLDTGIIAVRKALQLKPDYLQALHNYILALIDTRRVIRAKVILRRAERAYPHDPSIRRLALKIQTLTLRHILKITWRSIRAAFYRRKYRHKKNTSIIQKSK